MKKVKYSNVVIVGYKLLFFWGLFLLLLNIHSCKTNNNSPPEFIKGNQCFNKKRIKWDYFTVDSIDIESYGKKVDIINDRVFSAFIEVFSRDDIDYDSTLQVYETGFIEIPRSKFCSTVFYIKGANWLKRLVLINFQNETDSVKITSAAILSELMKIPMSKIKIDTKRVNSTVFEKTIVSKETFFEEETHRYFDMVDTVIEIIQINPNGEIEVISSDSSSSN
jgi:hypothetical protein